MTDLCRRRAHGRRRRAPFTKARHRARSRLRGAALAAVLAAGLPTAAALRAPAPPPAAATAAAVPSTSRALEARAPLAAARAPLGPVVRDPAWPASASRARRATGADPTRPGGAPAGPTRPGAAGSRPGPAPGPAGAAGSTAGAPGRHAGAPGANAGAPGANAGAPGTAGSGAPRPASGTASGGRVVRPATATTPGPAGASTTAAARAGTAAPAARPATTRPTYRLVTRVVEGRSYRGRASWYGPGFHGRRTASGERFDTWDMTAAHRTLPFGTRLRVCTKRRCVVVRINDRGPYVAGTVVDLSRAAARKLGIEYAGVARVTATVVETRTVRVPVAPPPAPQPAVKAVPDRRRDQPVRRIGAPALAPAAETDAAPAPGGGGLALVLVGGLAFATAAVTVGSAFAVRRRRGLSFVPGVDAPPASGRLELGPRPIRR